MTYEKSKTVFFTGRRPKDLAGYRRDAYSDLSLYLTEYLKSVILPSGIDVFVTGGAQGFDQLSFQAVDNLKSAGLHIANVVCIPFYGQESIWRPYGLFSQKDYWNMLDSADEVICTVNPKPDTRGGIMKALMDRNSKMMNMASTCIALWPDDDTWMNPATRSGTADAMRKAHANGLDLRILRYAKAPDESIVPIRVDKL